MSDFIFDKEYDSIIEIDEQTVGTLYKFNDGDFLINSEITQQDLQLLSLLSYTIHSESYELVQSSFVLKQLPDIYHNVQSDSAKILEYFTDKGTGLMLEGKYKLSADVDIIELKLSHMQKIRSYLEEQPSAIINTNPQSGFVTKASKKLETAVEDQKKVIIDDLEISNVILEDVCIGHPFYEIAKLICNIYLESKSKTITDIKKQIYKAYPKKEIDKTILDMGEQIIDAMISYFLIVELHESLETKVETERFTKLRNYLIKEKVLSYT